MAGDQRYSISLTTLVLGILLAASTSAAVIFGVLWIRAPSIAVPAEQPQADSPQVPLSNSVANTAPQLGTESPVDETDAQVLQKIREAAINAAKCDLNLLKQAASLANRSDAADFRERDVPLTLLIFLLNPRNVDGDPEELTRAIRFHDVTSPARIVAAAAKNRPGNHPNLISEQTIRQLTCKRFGAEARGEIWIEEPGILEARIHFVAIVAADEWRVIEFSLPEWDTRTVLQANGHWQASGRGVSFLAIRLPVTRAAPPRKYSAKRVLIVIGTDERSKQGDARPIARVDYDKLPASIGKGDEGVGFGKLVDGLRPKVIEFAAAAKIDPSKVELVFWLDRDVPIGSLYRVMHPADALGIRGFLLAADLELDDDPHQWTPVRGEFRIEMPNREKLQEMQFEEVQGDVETNIQLDKKAIPNREGDGIGVPADVELDRQNANDRTSVDFGISFVAQNESEAKPADDLPPPLSIRIRATDDGDISSMEFLNRPIPIRGDGGHFPALHHFIRELVVDLNPEDLEIEIDADQNLKCQHLISVLATCGRQEMRANRPAFVPFAKTFRLAPLRELPGK